MMTAAAANMAADIRAVSVSRLRWIPWNEDRFLTVSDLGGILDGVRAAYRTIVLLDFYAGAMNIILYTL